MRKEPTVSIGPGLLRIYSMCQNKSPILGTMMHSPHPSNPNPTPFLIQKYTKPFSCPGRKMSVVLDIASNVSESVGRA